MSAPRAEPGGGAPGGPRVGLLGGRRHRQGLGPYVARDLVAAGAAVPCLLTTSARTRDEAIAQVRDAAGVTPRGHVDLDAMLARERLDAVAILSPPEVHARHLEAALAAGLHVLCEKPFVWGVPDLAARTGRLVAAFEARGLVIRENCQWPYTLEDFAALHPGALDAPPRTFAMELEPISRGLQCLADALPHPISLLQALVPGEDARVEDVSFSTRDPGADRLSVGFRYRTERHACDAEVRLRCGGPPPRRAALEIDGRRARRVVSPRDYRLSFADSERAVPIADPLTRLVGDFVATLRTPRRPRGGDPSPAARDIERRMELLAAIAAAYAPEEVS